MNYEFNTNEPIEKDYDGIEQAAIEKGEADREEERFEKAECYIAIKILNDMQSLKESKSRNKSFANDMHRLLGIAETLSLTFPSLSSEIELIKRQTL